MKRTEILVIEPSAEVRRVLEEGLALHGFGVTTAASPEEALELASSEAFDLLIEAAPPLDRADTLRATQAAFPAVPVIVVNDDIFDPSVFRSAKEAGPRRKLLRRPFTLRELVGAVRSALPAPGEAGPLDRPGAPNA